MLREILKIVSLEADVYLYNTQNRVLTKLPICHLSKTYTLK